MHISWAVLLIDGRGGMLINIVLLLIVYPSDIPESDTDSSEFSDQLTITRKPE
jgi:hypothetical protein